MTGWTVDGDNTPLGGGRYELEGFSGSLLLDVAYTDPSCGPTPLRITATIELPYGSQPAPLDLAPSTLGSPTFVADREGTAVLFTAGAPTPTQAGFLALQVFNAIAGTARRANATSTVGARLTEADESTATTPPPSRRISVRPDRSSVASHTTVSPGRSAQV